MWDRGNRQCMLCGDECESVLHGSWECPVYGYIREAFINLMYIIMYVVKIYSRL